MAAYYNEIDPYAAQWLRNLIAAGQIPPGVVDERDIRDVEPESLGHFDQCHFFAGIGGWSRALRLAGWPDDRPVWTGSCPCQPFSAAGRGAGFADERHLWPHFHYLIEQCRPATVFGEQVASKDGLGWLDLVQADLEGSGYAVAAVDLCAAGIGAPHIRQRLWWMADAVHPGRSEWRAVAGGGQAAGRGVTGELADAGCERRDGQQVQLQPGQPRQTGAETAGGLRSDLLGDTQQQGFSQRVGERGVPCGASGAATRQAAVGAGVHYGAERPGPTNGFWRDADWLLCRDGKWRPVEPGTFPLAHGVPGRVGQLRAYGNAIVPSVAAEVIGTFMECA